MKFVRILLYPLSYCYGLFMRLRNLAFKMRLLPSESFRIPVISVGNLVAGGSGKTPMIEYIAELLGTDEKLAILSRGYKRRTKGYRLAGDNENVESIGDEPLQFHLKMPGVKVAVCESRRDGINRLMKEYPEVTTVLLDDAFQHRYVKPGISILLTDYFKPYYRDFMLPTGMLREPACGSKRADVIVITKTPRIFSPIVRKQMLAELNALPSQKVCFSYIDYLDFIPLFNNEATSELDISNVYSIIMLTGIANPDPFEEYLKRKCTDLESMSFADHYVFSHDDLLALANKYKYLPTKRKMIVTTEKDAQRLRSDDAARILGELPVFYVPIRFEFFPDDKAVFDKAVLAAANVVKN